MTSYKTCAVPMCKSTTIKNPNKLFIHVPKCVKRREQWIKLARRNPDLTSNNATIYFCADHFDLPNDMENYMEYHVMGSVSQVRMKRGCMPKKFICQPDRTTLTSDPTEQSYIVENQRRLTQQDCEEHFEESIDKEQLCSEEIASSSSVQQNVEEVPQLNPRVLDTSIQVNMFKAFRSKANKTQVKLPNHMANYMRYRIVGTVAQVRMIPGCTPTKFECQPDRKRRTCGGKERPYILKKKRIRAIEECMKKSEFKITSCPSLQDTSNISCQTVGEHAEEVLCKQKEKSFQVMTLKREIKEELDPHESQNDDILNLHTHIDIKQDVEDIDASVPNPSSASSSRTNSACGSPTREPHIESFTDYDPQDKMGVIVMKEEIESPSSDVSIHSRRDIVTEVAADVYQQHTKRQAQRNLQLTQIRYSNAERQRRYRAKQKADKMNACTRFSASSDVQQQTQNDNQIKKLRPQTNAERTRKHRQLLREKQQQQQQMGDGDVNVITVLSNKNVDPVERARKSRKLHLNKLRQSRFRERQIFKSASTSSQAKELGTQEKNVDLGRHHHDLEDLHSSDPSHSTASCSETLKTLKRKMTCNLDPHESQNDDSLNLHTHIDIKQEHLEDIDASIPTFSSVLCSQTNSACGSPTREPHIESFTEYDPLNTMDVIVMKEEPGSPSPEVFIHSDAADSPEEQTIEIKIRKKMEMLSQNEEIIKRRREEISILEKNNIQLLADIKYLQNVSKKKC